MNIPNCKQSVASEWLLVQEETHPATLPAPTVQRLQAFRVVIARGPGVRRLLHVLRAPDARYTVRAAVEQDTERTQGQGLLPDAASPGSARSDCQSTVQQRLVGDVLQPTQSSRANL